MTRSTSPDGPPAPSASRRPADPAAEPSSASAPESIPASRPRRGQRRGTRRRRWEVIFPLAFGIVAAVALAGREMSRLAARLSLPTGPAQWIWAAQDRRNPAPLAFDAAVDFELPARPPARARLLALADEEYVLYLNGKRVGAGRYRPGAALDSYEVGPLLLPGGNRLLAELRSGRGLGGFLASLGDETSGKPLVVTDGRWRIFRRHRLGLVRGWLPLAGSSEALGEAAQVWGLPPIGRWGRPAPGPRRPLFAELTGGSRPLAARTSSPYPPAASGGPALNTAGTAIVLFDWGREVEGYLVLEPGYSAGAAGAAGMTGGIDPERLPPPPDRLRVALLFAGPRQWAAPSPIPAAAPRLSGRVPSQGPPLPLVAALPRQPPAAAVLLLPGGREWLDAAPRRFRYALVAGIEGPLAARVYPVEPRAAAGLVAASELGDPSQLSDPGQIGHLGNVSRGVFGIAPPPLRTPVEDEVRRKLQGLAGVAGRKEL